MRPSIAPLAHRVGRIVSVLAATALVALAAQPVAAAGPAGGPTLTFQRILRGYDRPILVTHDGSPKRRLFIVEQTGRIRVAAFKDGAWRKEGTFLDLRSVVLAPPAGGSEQGLLGLAFPPDHAATGRFYVNYTRQGAGGRAGDTVVAEYRRTSATRADASSGRRVLVVDQPYANHNGGHLAFGPDGMLYIGLGDGGSGGDPEDRAQDLRSRLGKLLRIDPSDPPGRAAFRVPLDNPYIGETEKRLVWLSGVRNPWRFSFDRTTGDLWIGDVGQNAYEEVDHLVAVAGVDAGKGLNLGWDICEGDRTYPDDDPCPHASEGFTAPVYTYPHGGSTQPFGGCSVTGGVVIRTPGAATWHGRYLFGDYCTGRVGVLAADGSLVHTQESDVNILSFGEDRAGRIYVASQDGVIRQVRFSAVGP